MDINDIVEWEVAHLPSIMLWALPVLGVLAIVGNCFRIMRDRREFNRGYALGEKVVARFLENIDGDG